MLALVFDGQLSIEERPVPVPAPDEALVRVRLAGICNTDVEIARGYMNYSGVLGHEFVGVVEQCATRRWVGRRVVGEINAACGACDLCKKGLNRHCPNRTTLGIAGRDGAFAEFVSIPIRNLHEVHRSISDEQAVFVEPMAACYEILEQVDVRMAHRVAVIGDGKLGALAAKVLSTATPNLTLLGKHEEKLARIRDGLAVRTAFYSAQKHQNFDIVVECSGSPSGLAAATDLVKPRGTIVLKSTYHEKPQIDTSLWVIHEITVVGSRCGPFPPALDALRRGAVDPRPLIHSTHPARNALTAFALAQQPGVFKVLLDFSA